jgi:hypothetical protein
MELRSIVPWGRSFDEYRRMFALAGGVLAGRTLRLTFPTNSGRGLGVI